MCFFPKHLPQYITKNNEMQEKNQKNLIFFDFLIKFIIFVDYTFFHHFSFILWGIGFGALVTLFQTAVTRQVTKGAAIATSLQSAAFNFSIMIGSTVGGWLLARGGAMPIVLMGIILLVAGIGVSILAKRTLA